MNDPSSRESFNAQLLECYDKYDTNGELNYICDYRELDTGKVTEVSYQRQVWRGLHDKVGNVFVLERKTDMSVLFFLTSIIGVILFVVNMIRRSE